MHTAKHRGAAAPAKDEEEDEFQKRSNRGSSPPVARAHAIVLGVQLVSWKTRESGSGAWDGCDSCQRHWKPQTKADCSCLPVAALRQG
eukprot:1157382-Pelagomonas_calceolata.AAC.1